MDNTQAKKIIEILSKRWLIKEKKFFSEIIDFLDKGIDKKLSFFNGFEFSLIEKTPKIRLLHLYFWQLNLPIGVVKKILKKREKTIEFIFQKLSQEFNCRYNLSLFKSLIQFNKKNYLLPIQFGLEYQKSCQPKIKVYLSIAEPFFKKNFFLKNLCVNFGLNYQFLSKIFQNRKLDAIAIDFLPERKFKFKFYPILAKNKGLLYRFNKSSKNFSWKTWQRFPQGITIEEAEGMKFIKLPFFIRNYIIKNKFRISYLCQENGKKSIYFR